MTEAQGTDAWKAPYVSYETLSNFIDKKLGANPLPPRIDKGFVDNYAGSVQHVLLNTLKTMGLIDGGGHVLDPIREARESPDQRKKVFRAWAETFYAEQLELAEKNSTAQMLHESFARHQYTGSTLRKAIVFFLALVDDVGLPRSPHFKAPRQALVSSGSRRKKQTEQPPPTPPDPPVKRSEQVVVSFGEAGTVTIDVDVRWLDLPDHTFVGLRKIIRDLEALSVPSSEPADERGDEAED